MIRALAAICLAQDVLPGSEWSGIDGWILLMVREGYRIADSWEEARPESSLVVVFGEAPEPVPDLDRFVRRGGRMILASDRPSIDRVLEPFGLKLIPGPIRLRNSNGAFLGYRDCPIVHPSGEGDPVFEGVHELAFNRPAAFDDAQVKLRGLRASAHLPVLVGGSAPACLVHGTFGNGRAVFLSDHSPFVNLMLPELDNLKFGRNLLRAAGRRHVVFFYNGRLMAARDLPPRMLVLPPGTIRALNPALRHLEETGALNRYARNFWTQALGGLTIVILGIFAVWMYRREVEPFDPGGGALLGRFGSAAADPSRRNYALAARELLERVAQSPPSWPASKWRAWVARRRYHRLLNARALLGERVSARRFRRWLKSARELSESGIVKWTSSR